MYIPHKFKGEKYFIAINGCDAFGMYDSLDEALEAFKKFERWTIEDPKTFQSDFDKIKHIIKVTENGKEIVWKRY